MTLRRIIELFRPHWRAVAAITIAAVISILPVAITPFLLRAIVDRDLFCGKQCPHIAATAHLGTIMAAIVLAGGLIAGIEGRALASLGEAIMADLRERLFAHLHSVPIQFFSETRQGEIQSRLMNDVGSINQMVTQRAAGALANGVMTIGAVVAMAFMSWPLAVVSTAVSIPFALLTGVVAERSRLLWREAQAEAATVMSLTEEGLSFSGMLTTRIFGIEGQRVEEFVLRSRLLMRLRRAVATYTRMFEASAGTFFALMPLAVVASAAVLLTNDRRALTAGTLIAVMGLQGRLIAPGADLFRFAIDLRVTSPSFERVFEYLGTPSVTHNADRRPFAREHLAGTLEASDLWFRYNRTDPWLIRGASLRVEPGQIAAIIGPSGAGKTTLAYLLCGLVRPEHGYLSIGGHDIETLDGELLHELIAVVTQEPFLIHSSVRENLSLARRDATESQILQAARDAAIHDRIMELPLGYDTVVGARGSRLSGGERQRVALARALLTEPRVLILDEATSALDTETERQVHEALRARAAGRTTLIIAHRPSTIQLADVVFVLDSGRVAPSGTYAELVRDCDLTAQPNTDAALTA